MTSTQQALQWAMKELIASDVATVEALTAKLEQAKTIAKFQGI